MFYPISTAGCVSVQQSTSPSSRLRDHWAQYFKSQFLAKLYEMYAIVHTYNVHGSVAPTSQFEVNLSQQTELSDLQKKRRKKISTLRKWEVKFGTCRYLFYQVYFFHCASCNMSTLYYFLNSK